MNLVKVETNPVAAPEPNDLSAERYLCLVKITAQDGLVVWGELIKSIQRDPKRMKIK